jgi:hypothetical protein
MRVVIFALAFVINVVVHLSLAAAFGIVPGQAEVATLAAGLAALAMLMPQPDRMMREGLKAEAAVVTEQQAA